MSITFMSQVFRLPLKPTEKIVLLALADAADDDGRAWIAVRTKKVGKIDLLRKTSLKERTLQGAIRRLCEGRYLTRYETPGVGVVYGVYPAADAPVDDNQPPHEMRPFPAETAEIRPPHEMRPAADAPKPYPSGDKSPSGRARVYTCEAAGGAEIIDLPEWLEHEPLDAFARQRADRGKRLTPAGVRKLIERLAELRVEGLDPNERLRFSAQRCADWVFRPAAKHPAPVPVSSAGGEVQFRYQKPGEAQACAAFRERAHQRLGKKYHCFDYARFALEGNVLRIEARGPAIQHIQDNRLHPRIELAVQDLLPPGGKVQVYEISPAGVH